MNRKNINIAKNDMGEHLLFAAVRNDDISYARYFLNMGANVNKQNIHGRTCLMDAILNNSYPMIEFLLSRYADPTCKTMCGDDAVSYAIFATNGKLCFDIVKLLVDKGADPNNRDMNGNTNVFWAHVNGKMEICQLLQKYGAE